MPRRINPPKTLNYGNEFKAKAVQLSLVQGIKVSDVATSLGIHPFMLSRWRKEFREGKIAFDKRRLRSGMKKPQKDLSEVARLRRANERLRKENELLKKWQRYLAEQHQNGLDSSKDTGNLE